MRTCNVFYNLSMILVRYKTSSSRWVKRQLNDKFSQQAKVLNYKSRAAFKMLEIIEKYPVLGKHKLTNILDLGYSPGSWSQVIVSEMKKALRVFNILGVDLIRASPPPGVSFIQGDFLDLNTQHKIAQFFATKSSNPQVQLIVSDMLLNTTGIKDTDHLNSVDICTSVLDASQSLLSPNGNLVMKFYQGREQALIQQRLNQMFLKVYSFKPKSSRAELREIFFIGLKKLNVHSDNA